MTGSRGKSQYKADQANEKTKLRKSQDFLERREARKIYKNLSKALKTQCESHWLAFREIKRAAEWSERYRCRHAV